MDGVDDAKTKGPAAVIMRNRTPERNMRRIFGNAKGDEINDYLFRPVQDNEAERIRFVNRMHNEVRTFKDRNGKDRRLWRVYLVFGLCVGLFFLFFYAIPYSRAL